MRYQDRQPGSSAQLAPTAKKARQETVLPGTSPEPAPVSPPVNTLDPLLRTPLHLAIRAGNVGKVAELLQVPHVELNIPALHNRRTPLNEAITQGNHEIVALLIEASQGRHRTQTRLNGLTGRTERHIDAANYDGQFRLDPDISDCDGMTPLHHAVTRGDPRLVKLCCRSKALTGTLPARKEYGPCISPPMQEMQNSCAFCWTVIRKAWM